MDLFDYMKEQTLENESPLASRMRPRTLEEVAGQEHIIGKDKLLYRAIKADKLGSVIFYGPPGTGKRRWPRSLPTPPVPGFSRLTPQLPEKRYGGSGEGGAAAPGYVRKENHFVCRRNSPIQ